MARILKVLAEGILTAILLTLIGLTLVYVYPPLVGADFSYTIMGSSMQPTLHPGDLILINRAAPQQINVGDIIAVRLADRVFTHRVIEKRKGDQTILFKTKGDANEDPDPGYTSSTQIIGKVKLTIPLHHFYTPYGLAALVAAPFMLLVGNTFWRILNESKKRSRRQLRLWRKHTRRRHILDTTSILLLLILFTGGMRLMAPRLQGFSLTYFTDTENTLTLFTSGIWTKEIPATIDIKPETLNLKSKGQPITCYIELPEGQDVSNIIVDTICLNETIPAESHPTEIGDYDEDGIPDLMVKFNRSDVIEYLINQGYGDGDQVTLMATGMLTDRTFFKGFDSINLIGS